MKPAVSNRPFPHALIRVPQNASFIAGCCAHSRPADLLSLSPWIRHSNHPNIAAFWGAHLRQANEDEDAKAELWITMELCSYGSAGRLAQCVTFPKEVKGVSGWSKLRAGKPIQFGEDAIAHLLAGCVTALAFLHSRMVIHRDIKGHNILVASDFTVKLCDFGISTMIHEVKNKRNTTIGEGTDSSSSAPM